MKRRTGAERVRSLEIDRIIPDVGRLKRTIGTDSKAVRKEYNAMITALIRKGRIAVLQALFDDVYGFAFAYEKYTSGELDRMPSAATMLPLHDAWEKWTVALQAKTGEERQSDEHLKAHRHALTRLAERGQAQATVADLPTLLERLKHDYARKARTFNKTRASVQAFLRDLKGEGRRGALYNACADVRVLKNKRTRAPKPQSVAQMAAAAAVLSDDVMACLWSMASTGMLPKEYWFDGWEIALGSIHVIGQKRDARDRHIPNLNRCIEPAVSDRHVARALLDAAVGFQMKDMRNTFATWMENAGVPRTRRRMYLGHGAKDVTDLYEQAEIAQFLREDGDRLRAWVAAELEKSGVRKTRTLASEEDEVRLALG